MFDPITAEQQHLLEFEDNNLSGCFRRLLVVSNGSAETNEEARPSKRARLSEVPALGVDKLPPTREVEQVCTFLQLPLSIDLDEFCQTLLWDLPWRWCASRRR